MLVHDEIVEGKNGRCVFRAPLRQLVIRCSYALGPSEIAGQAGFRVIERCASWDEARDPSSEEQRFQIVLERI